MFNQFAYRKYKGIYGDWRIQNPLNLHIQMTIWKDKHVSKLDKFSLTIEVNYKLKSKEDDDTDKEQNGGLGRKLS